MPWLNKYQEAQFRGVTFYVPSAENSGGRRNAVFEFPKRDTPYVEDMGRKARRHSIEAIIVGDDYMDRRDRLIAALEKKGSGKFVHPYKGTLDVAVTDYSYRETVDEGRMVTFTISFVESGLQKYPSETIDTTVDVAVKKAAAIDSSKNAFVSGFENLQKFNKMVKTQRDRYVANINLALDYLEASKRTMSVVSSLKASFASLRTRISFLVLEAQELADDFCSIFEFGTNGVDEEPVTPDNAEPQLDEMLAMSEFEPLTPLGEGDPSTIFSALVIQNALINAMGLLSIIEFPSVEEAQEFRKIVFDRFEEILLDVKDDNLYTALEDLQTAVTRDLDVRSENLPRLISYTLPTTLPALAVSHTLYGTIDFEQEIIDRNKISHPSFIPAGVALEVRSNA